MDNEVFINANGATEGGIQYGSELELEVGSGDGNIDDATVDEVTLFFSGDFGRIELGKEDGAEDVMGIGGEDAQAGTGGIDGDTANLTTFEITDAERQHQGELLHAARRRLPARRQLHPGRRRRRDRRRRRPGEHRRPGRRLDRRARPGRRHRGLDRHPGQE